MRPGVEAEVPLEATAVGAKAEEAAATVEEDRAGGAAAAR
jgi:hypothetical protein